MISNKFNNLTNPPKNIQQLTGRLKEFEENFLNFS